jgi:ketosteroid isomerase-like protein
MSEADVDVVRQVVSAFRDRNVTRLRELFHDDAEFRSAIVTLEGGTYRGREEMERYMNELDAVFEDWHSEDEEFVDGGDGRVLLAFRIVGQGRGSGAPVNQPIAILWTVHHGRIRAAQGYLDPEEAHAEVSQS